MEPNEIEPKDMKLGVYKHYKDGAEYRALFVVTNATNASKTISGNYSYMVVYVALTGKYTGNMYAREFYEFHQKVKWDVVANDFISRFSYVRD